MTEQKALNNYLKSMFEKEESKSHLRKFKNYDWNPSTILWV